MNILYMKYAVEVEKTGSVSKAAENLFMGQPNLSRAVKELEEALGIAIFKRTSKGMIPTEKGGEFLTAAKNILNRIDEMEQIYMKDKQGRQTFSVCVPKVSYVAFAFAEFVKKLSFKNQGEIYYKETDSDKTINNVASAVCKLGIVRYPSNADKYFKSVFDEKNLKYEVITDFTEVLIMSKENPLAEIKAIDTVNLQEYIEIIHTDSYMPTQLNKGVNKADSLKHRDKRVIVSERAVQLDLLSSMPTAFMKTSPMPDYILSGYSLIQRNFNSAKKYKDVLIYRKDYQLNSLDNCFITKVCEAKRRFIDIRTTS